ncbi:periphilin-1 [Pelobates fuscus]|uniref:periphilin-1 n=1 Tax=Pelobates fuscus TaxID=191477 RepID=UPI002FE4A7D2
MDYRKDEMWADGRYDYERIPRQRLVSRGDLLEGEYHRVVNVVNHRRAEDETYPRYEEYGEPEYRDYEEGHGYTAERRGGLYRGDSPGYRWQRGDPHVSRQPEYRENREGFRRKPMYPPNVYMRERSPHRRESLFFRDSPVTQRDSPHSRSGSSVSSRSYSPDRGKSFPSHQHSRSKERPVGHPLKSPRDVSPSSSASTLPAKAVELDKSSRSEGAFVETSSMWAADKMELSENNAPETTDEYVKTIGQSSALYGDPSEELEANVSATSEIFEVRPHNSRAKAIAAKTKEIEEVYRQDCETFGMVVKMLIDKDPSLEKQVQYALKQNLSEIGERCIEELKMYIMEYDDTQQELA